MKAASFPWCQRIAFVETGYQTTASSFDRSQKRWWVKEYKVIICFYPLHPSIKWKESMPYLSYIILNFVDHPFWWFQVNIPKQRRTFCKGKKCRRHTLHKVTQYKAGKASLYAQGKLGLRQYRRNGLACCEMFPFICCRWRSYLDWLVVSVEAEVLCFILRRIRVSTL